MTERLDAEHDRRRALPHPAAPRLGRHGRRLLRRGPAARPQGRAEAALPPLRRGPGVRRALPPRGVARPPGLQHQHVVSVYDRGECDGTYYIAMEYLEGRSLKRIVQRGGAAGPRARDRPDHPVLRAARFAHRRGIIHRDLKPHNVIVDERGPREGHRLRHRPRRRVGHDADRLDHGHRAVPLARAGPGPRRRAPRRTSTRSGSSSTSCSPAACPFDGESAVTIALKQVSETPVPPSACNPAVTAGARGRRAARAGEGPGAPLRRRRRVHRRARGRPRRRAAGVDDRRRAAAGRPDARCGARRRRCTHGARSSRSRRRTSAAAGVAWWIWALALLLVVGAVIAGAALLGGGDEVAGPRRRRRRPRRRRARAARRASRSRRTRRNDDEPRRTGHRPGPVRREPRRGGLDGDADGLRRARRSRASPASTASRSQSARRPGSSARASRSSAASRPSDSVERGRVIASSPAEGAEAERGSTVTLVVSTGAEQVAVPDVVGSTEDEARSKLERRGLRVTVRREDAQDEEPGTVLRQDPPAGREVDDGLDGDARRRPASRSEVDVPDVTGETQADARRRAVRRRLQRSASATQPVDRRGRRRRRASSQDPAGGNAPSAARR